MDQFFMAILTVFFGGFLSLVFARKAKLMRITAVLFLSLGCLLGLIDAGAKLMHPLIYGASFQYLKVFSLTFKIDGLSAFFLVAIFAVSLMASIYSFHYMEHSKKTLRVAANYFFFSLLIVAMALVVTAANAISFLFSWEIMSLSSFFLVIYNYESSENRRAGYLYFVFSHVGAMFIFVSFAIAYGYTGSFNFENMGVLPETAKNLIFLFSFVGFGSKAGVFPFHVWLPHAHPAAPSHISAVMSGVMIKTGIYGIIRMYALLDFHNPVFGYLVLLAGVVSGILGVVYALGQHDLKRLLAYHSVENIGIILIGLGVGMIGVSCGNQPMAVLGFAGGLFHVLNHSIFKSLLFMGAGMVLHRTGTTAINALGGLLKNMRITGATFIVGSLAICGLPPFNGFVSEFFIYMGAFKGIELDKTAFAMGVVAIISLAIIGGLALACFTKVVGIVFQGEPRTKAAENADEKGCTMLFSMVFLSLACILIGTSPGVFVYMTLKAVSALGVVSDPVMLEPFNQMAKNITQAAMIVFISVLFVIAIRWFLYRGKTITTSGTWGCGFTQPTVKMQYTGTSYAASILEFFSFVAPLHEDHLEITGRFPEKTFYQSHVNDIAELYMKKVIVDPVLYLFDKLRWIQHGDIHLYIGYIMLAIVLLLFFI